MTVTTTKATPYQGNMSKEGLTSSGPEEGRTAIAPISVIRPLSGLELKERRPAYLSILDADGNIDLLYSPYKSSWSGKDDLTYTSFSLMQVQETREEKFQIMETFGEDFIYLFGERPRFLACSGILVNSKDHNWRAAFWENYDKKLRGTKLAENRQRAYLSWDDILVEGYIMSAKASDDATQPYSVAFMFTFLVTDYVNMSVVKKGAVHESEIIGDRRAEMKLLGTKVDLGLPMYLLLKRLGLKTDTSLANLMVKLSTLSLTAGSDAKAQQDAAAEIFGDLVGADRFDPSKNSTESLLSAYRDLTAGITTTLMEQSTYMFDDESAASIFNKSILGVRSAAILAFDLAIIAGDTKGADLSNEQKAAMVARSAREVSGLIDGTMNWAIKR